MSKHFHCIIHAKPGVTNSTVKGTSPLTLETSLASENVFKCSFEDVVANFESLPRMFLEPDGSFVWVIQSNTTRFQLDGLLVDNGTNLISVELKGACDEATLEQVLTAVGWPEQEVVFQLVQQGVCIDQLDFRELFLL